MDLHAKQLREEFWRNDALKGSPIGKPYKEIEFLSESSEEAGRDIRIEQVNEIPVLASGKRKPVVNEWKNVIL